MEKPAPFYDVCIVCALPEEAKAFLEVVELQCGILFAKGTSPGYHDHYRATTIKNDKDESLNLHLSWLPRYGPQEMVLHLDRVLQECKPRLVLMTGICAGDAKQVQLGDLVVAERTFTYDNGKYVLDEQGRVAHQHDTTTYQLDANILQFLGLFDAWKSLMEGLERPPSPRQRLRRSEIACHIKPMASGSAVRADHPFEEVRAPVRGTVAIDLESAAFGLVMNRHSLIRWLVVKGVCDYADPKKDDIYHDFAARASALYALSFIQAYVTHEWPPRLDKLLSEENLGKLPEVWNIPNVRNLLFTGREALIQELREKLNMGPVALTDEKNTPILAKNPPKALRGTGGIGKTQTAIEYAYRYCYDYETVLWVKADTRENILSGFIEIVTLLNLPEKELLGLPEKDEKHIIDAVKKWLNLHTKWLLIFDNADDLPIVQEFLPQFGTGHILLTTRDRAVDNIATCVEINPMEEDDGTQLLLRRAGLLEPTAPSLSDVDRKCAGDIVEAMGGLPLALDQAGAFIKNSSSLCEYLHLYREHHQKHRNELLELYSELWKDYPYTVARVWDLSFEKVNQIDPVTTELLSLCAFLDPDAIPENIITGGTQALGPVLGPISSEQIRMKKVIGVLVRFSLVQHNSQTNMLTIHRLVQAVIQDSMDEEIQRTWAERAIRTVHHAFPDKVNDVKTWSQCQHYLPHALACAKLIKDYELVSLEAAQLLNQVGYYLREQARFREAEECFGQALTTSEKLGSEHLLYKAQILNNLARLYFDQYQYTKAERIYEQALAIREQELGPEGSVIAQNLNSLALNCWYEGKYEKAEPLYERALRISISDQKLGPKHAQTLYILNNQALLYRSQRKYEEAIKLNQDVLKIRENKFGRVHLDVAQSLQNLAVTYYYEQSDKEEQGDQSKYEEAEDLLKQALAIREELYPEKHPQIARCLNYLALVYQVQGKYEEAAPSFKRAMDIRKDLLGAENPQTISIAKSYHSLLQILILKLNKEVTTLEERSKIFGM